MSQKVPLGVPQKVRWVSRGEDTGIETWSADTAVADFVLRNEVVAELEKKLLPQAFARSSKYTVEARGRGAHAAAVWICDANGNLLYEVWFGNTPKQHEAFDGLVHITICRSQVLQVWQRYSDGGYRLLLSNVATLDPDQSDREPLP